MLTQKRNKIEAVEIQEKRFGYFPKTFRWRGRQYHVEAVERCWTVTNNRRSRSMENPRLYFRVRCPEGAFDLIQDVRVNAWHLSTVS